MNGKRIVVGVTQRVNMEISHNELRDTLDHKLISWISNSGFIAVPIPNNLVALGLSENSQVSIENWISELNIGALVLSGGNDIGDIPKRDLTERALLSWAEEHKIPTFGICRGMQIMGVYAGSKLVKNDGHVKVRHQLQSNYGDISLKTVNSYHNFSLKECPALYEVIAKSEDGSIEAIKHKTLPWEAWMWHPEREDVFNKEHQKRFKTLIEGNRPKVIILAAGEGTRLRPYTLDKPKCMVKVDGISLLDRQLKVLRSANLNKIVIVGGYKSDMLKRDGVKLRNNPRYYETNMLWTLFCAEDELTEGVIISYGDIVYSGKILQKLLESTADIAVTIDKNWDIYWKERNENPLDDAETLKLRADGTISEIGKKPKFLNEIEGQYMGLMKFSIKGIEQLRRVFYEASNNKGLFGKTVENAYMTDILQAVIDSGGLVASVPVYSDWVEVDTVKDLNLKIVSDRLKGIYHE